MIRLLCLLLLSPAAPAQTQEDLADQGQLYVKKKRFKQAKAVLDKAYGMKGGPEDFVTVYNRGRAAFELLLVETAFEMAGLATKTASTDRQKSRAAELQSELDALFGKVVLEAASKETNPRGRIHFEARTGIINKTKKARFLSIQTRFQSTDITLPATVYLPYGEYLANKVPVSIQEGQPAPRVEIFLHIDGVQEGDGGVGPWVWVGAGTVAAVGIGVAAFFLFDSDPETKEEIDLRISN